jgi:hypothetical protein
MSKFTFPKSITSRPIYSTLEARQGPALFIADAQGAQAILDVSTPELMACAHIIYIPRGADFSQELRALNPAQFYEGSSYAASLQRIRHVLAEAKMGLQVYLSGTEGLMGQAATQATQAGIHAAAIQSEHRGSTARRMQCVHCKGITEDVVTDPFVCSHCGLNLFVRDHYSRRLAAFQGVCVDAEDPGNIPEKKGLYE